MRAANSGFTLKVNGSTIVITKVSGRGETCGHTWTPSAHARGVERLLLRVTTAGEAQAGAV